MAELDITHQGTILTLRLNRPAKKNAVTDSMYRDIAAALIHADQDPEMAVVVIEAEGPHFCAGNDMAALRDLASGAITLGDLHTNQFLTALSTFGKPLLAAVTGRAIGVGSTLLLHCDVVYAAHDARLSFPFVNMALVPEAGSAYLLTARIGYPRAYRLFCLEEAISGQDAAAIGLITASFPAQQVHTEISATAARLAAKSTDALRATKALMRDRKALAAAMAADQAEFLARLATTEVSELMRKLLAPAPNTA